MTSLLCFMVYCLVYSRRASFKYNMAYGFTVSTRLTPARTIVEHGKSTPILSRTSFSHPYLGNVSNPSNGNIASLDMTGHRKMMFQMLSKRNRRTSESICEVFCSCYLSMTGNASKETGYSVILAGRLIIIPNVVVRIQMSALCLHLLFHLSCQFVTSCPEPPNVNLAA